MPTFLLPSGSPESPSKSFGLSEDGGHSEDVAEMMQLAHFIITKTLKRRPVQDTKLNPSQPALTKNTCQGRATHQLQFSTSALAGSPCLRKEDLQAS